MVGTAREARVRVPLNVDSTRFFWDQEKNWIVSDDIRCQRRQDRKLVIAIVTWRRSRAFIDADIPSTAETHFSHAAALT